MSPSRNPEDELVRLAPNPLTLSANVALLATRKDNPLRRSAVIINIHCPPDRLQVVTLISHIKLVSNINSNPRPSHVTLLEGKTL
jgi:hypothetical protein